MKRNLFFFGVAALLIFSLSSCNYIDSVLKENTEKESFIFIYSTKSKQYSIDQLSDTTFINKQQFLESIKVVGDTSNWKAGKYKISAGMTDYDILKLLNTGKKETIKLTLTYGRIPENFIGRVCKKIEADSATLMQLLKDENYLSTLNTDVENAISLFIPNTYEFYWDTDEKEFLEKMKSEHDKFWNEERKQKCDELKMTPKQVYILGSIVQSEQSKIASEWPIIAGLYLNRLRIGMPLQSDPTVLFAMKKFTANRVYYSDLKHESLYNTYIHTGLPPGPICMVQPKVIDAVLNPNKNSYLYMCASYKLDGTHTFATNLGEHERNANAYRRALNKAGIR